MNKARSNFGFQFMALSLTVFVSATPANATPVVGQPAPAFTVTDSNGKSQSLSQYRGKYVVLEWTNDQCPFVRKHYGSGNMQSLQKEATGKGAVWLSINSSAQGREGYVDAAEANALLRKNNAAPNALLLDPNGTVGKMYQAKTTPHMYIIDPKGNLIYMGGIDDKPSTSQGDIQGATNYVRVALNEAMAGKTVSNPVTRPYGCSVKY